MLRLPDSWIWDSWFAFDGEVHHAFFLRASRALQDPFRRHRHPYIGHATSLDLVNWELQPDAIAISDAPAWDSWTTWTGSVTRDHDGTWWMFYTGTSREDGGDIQRVGAAVSSDLLTWTKVDTNPLTEANAEWYEELDYDIWHDQAWRDPWVFKFEDSWHMLVTARANSGEPFGRGVVGHAVSKNLREWTVLPPITATDSGFGQMEVVQVVEIDGQHVMLWCCGPRELSHEMREKFPLGGMFSVTGASPLGPFSPIDAVWFPHENLYAARAVKHGNQWYLIGFIGGPDDHTFGGYLSDPIPVRLHNGGLVPDTEMSRTEGALTA